MAQALSRPLAAHGDGDVGGGRQERVVLRQARTGWPRVGHLWPCYAASFQEYTGSEMRNLNVNCSAMPIRRIIDTLRYFPTSPILIIEGLDHVFAPSLLISILAS